jgi:hypothetical protein
VEFLFQALDRAGIHAPASIGAKTPYLPVRRALTIARVLLRRAAEAFSALHSSASALYYVYSICSQYSLGRLPCSAAHLCLAFVGGVAAPSHGDAGMSKSYDRTAMAGARVGFQTTHWSQISRARTNDADERKQIIDNLIRTYWKPVYCYLRCKGYRNEKAKDLTQGFFHEIVLERDLIRRADRSRGRFRTFVLTALDHYVSNEHRRETAAKRTPSSQAKGVDFEALPDLPVARFSSRPEQVFNYAWATTLLDEVVTEVKKSFCETGRTAYWEVFRARVLAPIVENAVPAALPDICKQYGVDNEAKASNMIVTVKRRFRSVLELKLRQVVQDDSTVEAELAELLDVLSKGK